MVTEIGRQIKRNREREIKRDGERDEKGEIKIWRWRVEKMEKERETKRMG